MYQAVIGLEIHIELNTKTKMFCACANDSGETKPNVNVCEICLGHPGTLPVINEEAIKKTIKTGLALNCEIPEHSKFDRKNYFYPDLPKGYQISQYDMPLCKEGFLEINNKKIKIRRIHLEEDTGKLIHPENSDYSLVDFNRAGVPLMELVTEPDINSANEARKFSEELQLILRYLGVSFADMEKGEMRVEANISLTQSAKLKTQNYNLKLKTDEKKLGTKVEIKNLNSFRVVEKAIDYEIKRQTEVLEKAEKVIQETRGWDEKNQKTFSQREKEEAHDYRYFPEPDLPILRLGTEDYLKEIKAEITELPRQKRERFKKEYGLSEKETEVYISKRELAEFFENAASELRAWIETEKSVKLKAGEFKIIVKVASNYLSSDLLGIVGDFSNFNIIKITPENFAEFVKMIYLGQIFSKIAKTLLLEMFQTGKDPSRIIEEKGLVQISDEKEIEKIIKETILKNQKAIKDYKKGKESALQFLIGKIMSETKGKANPQMVKELVIKFLTNFSASE